MTPAGQAFGKYEILRQLGAGGMGEILLARQPGLAGVDRLVVLKKILPHLARDPGFLQRFVDETRVAASLSHGNIVQVHDVGEVDGTYYMAMEYVEGLDLKEVLGLLRAGDRRMPEHLALYVLVEVAKALAYAHGKRDAQGTPLGIVHRDVSPANLLLSWDGQVKLADFGVAKAAMRLALTLPGTLHGKVYYMSPEQVVGEDCDPRSDVFSLGIVAYEMLAGRRPFEGESEVAVIDQVRRCEPPALTDVAPWVPPSLARLVARALERRPADRYASMDEFEQALTQYLLESHTMVSARVLADFLADVRRDAPVPQAPGSPSPSLEELAAGLLARTETPVGSPVVAPEAAGERTRTVATPPATSIPAPPAPANHPARRAWTVAAVLAILLVAVGAAAWRLLPGGPAAPGATEPVTVVAPATEAPPAMAAAPVGTPPAGEAPTPPPAPASAPAPAAIPDAKAGETREAVPDGEKAGTPAPRKTLLRSDPRGAEVFLGSRRLGLTPLELPIPATGTMRLALRRTGHADQEVAVGPDAPPVLNVTLARPTGELMFRFFPADCRVLIDDEAVRPAGNRVEVELPEGKHVVKLLSPEGDRSRTEVVHVDAGRVTKLGTLELDPQAQETP